MGGQPAISSKWGRQCALQVTRLGMGGGGDIIVSCLACHHVTCSVRRSVHPFHTELSWGCRHLQQSLQIRLADLHCVTIQIPLADIHLFMITGLLSPSLLLYLALPPPSPPALSPHSTTVAANEIRRLLIEVALQWFIDSNTQNIFTFIRDWTRKCCIANAAISTGSLCCNKK